MIRKKVSVFSRGWTGENTKASGKMGNNMERESTQQLMANLKKVTGLKEKDSIGFPEAMIISFHLGMMMII